MESQSVNRLFRAGKLQRDGFGPDMLHPGKPLRTARPLDAESLEGRLEGRRRGAGGGVSLSLTKKLFQRAGASRNHAGVAARHGGHSFDTRQRAIVKIHYFGHGGAGAAALRAHARYVARDAAVRTRETALLEREPGTSAVDGGAKMRAHGRYLENGQSRGVFYDALEDGVDGAARAARWTKQDRRHFRLILAPENGSELGDLRSYTRDVMRRAEDALGTRLQWIAVDHWDTDNPHTHIILRGRRDDGRDLVVPREFVRHGFRSAARDVATERLGRRTQDDERLALRREARAHRPTRLDELIEAQLDKRREVRIAHLEGRSADMSDALRARAHELKRLGIATEIRRNVIRFEPDWRDRLKAMELHLDIRKALIRSRSAALTPALRLPGAQLP
jgi:type IV secretory pathway VirD2 relaxase